MCTVYSHRFIVLNNNNTFHITIIIETKITTRDVKADKYDYIIFIQFQIILVQFLQQL